MQHCIVPRGFNDIDLKSIISFASENIFSIFVYGLTFKLIIALVIEATSRSEKSVNFYQSTRAIIILVAVRT
jgi:uncharacterized membrane protein